MDLKVLHQLSYGMYILSASDRGRPVGCVINTCIQITSENPTVAISVNKNNYTYEVIQREKRFALSILSEDTNPNLIASFGFSSGKERDKYEGFSYEMREGLPYILENTCGLLICEVVSVADVGTHAVIFGRLTDTESGTAAAPMTYAYYHKVIKGKAPKNAPTYQAESETLAATPAQTGEKWVCDLCGYVYEGDLTKEPDNYVCPICGAGKSLFSRKS